MSESEEYVKALKALLKERESAKETVFGLHALLTKTEQARDQAVESAKIAGTKILELQTELATTKTELEVSDKSLGFYKDKVEYTARFAAEQVKHLDAILSRARGEIKTIDLNKIDAPKPEEVPVITEEQLEVTQKLIDRETEETVQEIPISSRYRYATSVAAALLAFGALEIFIFAFEPFLVTLIAIGLSLIIFGAISRYKALISRSEAKALPVRPPAKSVSALKPIMVTKPIPRKKKEAPPSVRVPDLDFDDSLFEDIFGESDGDNKGTS